jgi:hypothetical protein
MYFQLLHIIIVTYQISNVKIFETLYTTCYKFDERHDVLKIKFEELLT